MDHRVVHVRVRRPDQAHAPTVSYAFGDDLPAWHRVADATIPVERVDALLREAATHYYPDAPDESPVVWNQRLERMGRELYELVDTERHLLGEHLANYPAQLTVLALRVDGALRHLPWELLHNGQEYLVEARRRRVVVVRVLRGTLPPSLPKVRPLQVIVMTSGVEDDDNPLDGDAEAAAITGAADVARLRVERERIESGRLDDLEQRLGQLQVGHFDVVHLSGHGRLTQAGPVFVAAGKDGTAAVSSTDALRDALETSAPQMLIVSACQSAASDDGGRTESLAEALTGVSARTVIGWARRVRDTSATAAVTDLYRHLAGGRAPAVALADAQRRLLRQQGDAHRADWHTLRMFSMGTAPAPLVTALGAMEEPASLFDKPGAYTPWELDRIREDDFVDRRAERAFLQHRLDPAWFSETPGVVVHGVAGVGKTALLSLALGGIRKDSVVWVPVRIDQNFDRWVLLAAMRRRGELADRLEGDTPGDLVPLLVRVLRSVSKPVIFVMDNLETGLQTHTSKARLEGTGGGVLTDLIAAIRESGRPHRIAITSRYVPEVDGITALEHLRVPRLGDADIARRLALIPRAVTLAPATAKKVIVAAHGNNRLLESVAQTAIQSPNVPPERLRLAEDLEAFIDESLRLDELTSRFSVGDVELLHALSVFAVPVPLGVVTRLREPAQADREVVGSRARRDARTSADQLARWTLLERHEGPEGERYRVPDVVVERLRATASVDPDRCAWALALELGPFEDAVDPARIDADLIEEVDRLARRGRIEPLVVRSAQALSQVAFLRRRFSESVDVLQRALDVVPHPLLSALLGRARAERGEGRAAVPFLQIAWDGRDQVAPKDRGRLLSCVAFWSAPLGLGHDTMGLVVESRDLARASGDISTEADAVRQIANLVADQDREHAARLFVEARELAERLPDPELLTLLIEMDRISKIDIGADRLDEARHALESVLETVQARALELHEAAFSVRLANVLNRLGEPVAAWRAAHRADSIARDLGWLRMQFDSTVEMVWLTLRDDGERDVAEAERLVAQLRTIAEQSGLVQLRRHAMYVEIRLLREMHDHAAARRLGETIEGLGEETASERAGRLVLDAEFLSRDDKDDEALAAARDALALLGTGAVGADTAPLTARADRVVVEIGNVRDAPAEDMAASLDRLREHAREHTPELLAAIAMWTARLEAREGRPARAIEALEEMIARPALPVPGPDLAYAHELLSSIEGRTTAQQVHDLATAACLRWRFEQPQQTASALRELARVADPTQRERVLLAALAIAEAWDLPLETAAVLKALVSAGRDAPGNAELLDRATEAERRGEPLSLAVGSRLAAVLDPDEGGHILAEVELARARLRSDGVTLPAVRVFDDVDLYDDEFLVRVWGEPDARGRVAVPSTARDLDRVTIAQALVGRVETAYRAGPGAARSAVPRPLTAAEHGVLDAVLDVACGDPNALAATEAASAPEARRSLRPSWWPWH
jgi:hypothetical protein